MSRNDPPTHWSGHIAPNGTALGTVRICDFTGQLAGAGATKWLAAFGAEVIRIEDPVNQGMWDVLRNMAPFIDDRRGPDYGGGFNNHNVEKRGITLNLRTDRGKEILTEIIAKSDVVSENFAAGVLRNLRSPPQAHFATASDPPRTPVARLQPAWAQSRQAMRPPVLPACAPGGGAV